VSYTGRHLLHPAKGEPSAAKGVRSASVMAATGLAMFVTNLDFFALNLSVPGMARELHVSATDMQWVISGYMLALAAFLIPGGRLGDILGRKRMLMIGLAIFGGTSLVCGLGQSAGFVIGFRVLQGLGAAILFPLSIAVVTNSFPEERRKRAIGNLYGLGAVATAAGPVIGGLLTEAVSWRAVFLVNVPFVALAILLTLRGVAESRDESVPRRIDLTGLATVTAGIAAVTFAVDRGDVWGWGSAATLGMIAGGLVLLVVFVAIERRVRYPLVDLSLFRNRPYVIVTISGMVANISFVVATFASTLYLQQVKGYSPIVAGLIFLAASASTACAGPLSGRLAEHYDVPRLMRVAIGIGALGLLAMSFGTDLWLYLPALAVFGIGYGLCWALSSVGTQTVVPQRQAGAASGLTLSIVIGVAGLCVALTASMIEVISHGGTSQGDAIEDVLRTIAIGSAAFALVLTLVAGRLRVGPARPETDAA
jgi:EmrB/QacA subfamily drug resistance transporter